MKNTYDLRGSQGNILRLASFDKEALLHMLFYRLMVIIAPAAALMMVYRLLLNTASFNLVNTVVLTVWIVFTPQLFATAKAFSLISSKGVVFGHLNESFLNSRIKKKRIYAVYKAIPYVVLMVWAIGFLAFLVEWLG